MPNLNLTQDFVDSVKYDPNGKQNQIYHDDKLKGLCLQVGKTKNSWCIQHHSRPRKRFADAREISLRKARIDAKGYLSELGKKIDPWKPQATDESPTLRTLFDRYKNRAKQVRPVTIKDMEESFERYLSDWWDIPYASITRDEIEQRWNKICAGGFWSEKKNAPMGKPSTALATFGYLRTVLRYGSRIYGTADPTVVIEDDMNALKRKNGRHRRLSDEELKTLGECFANWPDDANPRIPHFVRLLLFTGWRVRVAMELRWEYIKEDRIEQPETQSKAGRVLVTPLTDEIRRELDALREYAYDAWVFPSDSKSGHATTSNWAAERVKRECGLHFTNHSLRYSFATIGNELGIEKQVIALLLDHSCEDSITDKYMVEAYVKRTHAAIEELNTDLDQRLWPSASPNA